MADIIKKAHITILLVEDDKNDQELILDRLYQLTSFNPSITLVNTLEHTLNWLQKAEFNLIILDLGLPDSKGLNTIEIIRSISPMAKILIFTGAPMENQLLLENNIKGFFPKSKLVDDNAVQQLEHEIAVSVEVENVRRNRTSIKTVTSNLEKEIAKCKNQKKLE